jgi:hypothetical protein
MSYRNSLVLIPALSFVLSVSAMADITLNNGADINMNGSAGSTIIFFDGTIQSTAATAGTIPDGHGGTGNTVTGSNAFVGGGSINTASGGYATVGGGGYNTASGYGSTVAGGGFNAASGFASTVGGGYQNTASDYAAVGGGKSNTASGHYAMVGGGGYNMASGDDSTVGGGVGNTASGFSSTVGGGISNTAAGDYSFAAGRRATIDAAHDGTFIFADSTLANFDSAAANEFAVRANGGVRFITDSGTGAGVGLNTGDTSWNVLSAKDSKENYTHVDAVHILEQVVELPIERWNYRHQDDSVKHIGPYAEDFHAAFGLHGESNRTISSQDLDGIALAAIQGLNQKLTQELADVRAEKQTEIDSLREQFASLEQRLLAMEASMK